MRKKQPEYLYRYRSFNHRNIESLYSGEMWASSPITFNDPFDTYMSVDYEQLKSFINNIPENLSDKDKSYIDNFMKQYLVAITKKGYHIVSLSTENDNTTMWSHYAAKATGYVEVYSYNDLLEMKKQIVANELILAKEKFDKRKAMYDEEKLKNIINERIIYDFVKYRSKMYDFTKGFIEEVLSIRQITQFSEGDVNSILNLFLTGKNAKKANKHSRAISLQKNSNWSYENEYRIIVPNMNVFTDYHDYKKLGNILPIAVITGEYMNIFDKYLLYQVCKKRNITFLKSSPHYADMTTSIHLFEYTKDETDNLEKLEFFDDLSFVNGLK